MNGSEYQVLAPPARTNGARTLIASLLVTVALVASFTFGRVTAPPRSVRTVEPAAIPGLVGGSHVTPRAIGTSHVTPGSHQVPHGGIRLHHGVVKEG